MKKGGNKSFKYILIVIIVLVLVVIVVNNYNVIYKMQYPVKYEEYVRKYAHKYEVDPLLVFSIIKAESGFNSNAISHKHARGLMQISETTGKWGASNIGLEDYSENDLYDPETNVHIGCWYINVLKSQFNDNIDLVITAYNGGSGNVSKWLKDPRYSTDGYILKKIPFKETENYLKKVKSNYEMYKRLYDGYF